MIFMKKNEFNVKKKSGKLVILEEEKNKNRFLLFFLKNRKVMITGIFLLFISLLLISVGIAFSLFRGSNDYDITYITGSEQIDSNNDPDIDDDDIENELLGEVAREEGIVLLTDTFMTSRGDVISYFTDGTTVIVMANGKTYRVSPDDKGNYGVGKSGKIEDGVKKILVTSTTTTLSDGSIITNYSDGSARVELNDEVIFIRDSNNIELTNGNMFNKGKPSGVALNKNTINTGKEVVNYFTDNTVLVNLTGNKYIVNKNTIVSVDGKKINYDKNNSFKLISEKTYDDGNTISHYSNGSAVITMEDGNVVYVRRSGDLKLKDKKLYEIVPNMKGYSRGSINISNNTTIVYFDNGGAVIVYHDNNRVYVEDADDIVYGGNNNIISEFESAKLVNIMITDKGEYSYNFDNGKSQVITDNKSSYIVETDTLTLRPIEEDKEPEEDVDKPSVDDGVVPEPIDPGKGIIISEAEHEHNEFKNVQSTKFTIKNNNTSKRSLRIVIQEVTNYKNYDTSRLEPKFVKFQATIGDDYVPASYLTDNSWTDSNGVTSYIIYDGDLRAKDTVEVNLSLYVDYSLLNNSHQNKGFIGTIRIYVDA